MTDLKLVANLDSDFMIISVMVVGDLGREGTPCQERKREKCYKLAAPSPSSCNFLGLCFTIDINNQDKGGERQVWGGNIIRYQIAKIRMFGSQYFQ